MVPGCQLEPQVAPGTVRSHNKPDWLGKGPRGEALRERRISAPALETAASCERACTGHCALPSTSYVVLPPAYGAVAMSSYHPPFTGAKFEATRQRSSREVVPGNQQYR